MPEERKKAEKLKEGYSSPRWTMEIPDCSMPMTFDTYSKCAYNCLYCFSYFQKEHSLNGYIGGGKPRTVGVQKTIDLFEKARRNDTKNASKTQRQFFPYIQARKIMQWGGAVR